MRKIRVGFLCAKAAAVEELVCFGILFFETAQVLVYFGMKINEKPKYLLFFQRKRTGFSRIHQVLMQMSE